MNYKRYSVVNRFDEVSKQASVVIDEVLKDKNMLRDDKNPEIVIVVGGDGTFLHAVHQYIEIVDEVHFVAVHTGTLGFFADYHINELNLLLKSINNIEPEIDQRKLLEIEATQRDGTIDRYYAVNEMRIENVYKTQIIKVWINKIFLETFRGTGLCLSTQAGSTGFNKSLKGAVVENGLDILQMTEISGIHNKVYQSLQVPLLLKETSEVTYSSNTFADAVLCYDHLSVDMKNVKHVICRLSSKKVQCARFRESNFIHKVKDLF